MLKIIMCDVLSQGLAYGANGYTGELIALEAKKRGQPATLVKVPEYFFARYPVESQVVLAGIRDASEILGHRLGYRVLVLLAASGFPYAAFDLVDGMQGVMPLASSAGRNLTARPVRIGAWLLPDQMLTAAVRNIDLVAHEKWRDRTPDQGCGEPEIMSIFSMPSLNQRPS